jgi:tetratricopeptide (TPR) repeat protein
MRARFASRPSLSTVFVVLALLVAAAAAVALAARPARAAGPDAAAVAAAKGALQSGVDHGKAQEILAARAQFAALSAAAPEEPTLHYWVALASWRAVPLMKEDDAAKAQAKKICKDAIERCDKALAKAPRHADTIALKAGLQGLWLSFDPAAMMTLGMQMEQAMERARELEPANPRVVFLDGINTFHKPAFVGGGADKARVKFDQAIALFAKAAPGEAGAAGDPAALAWGADDAFVWAGRAAMKEKDYAAARAYYQKALAANPNNGWVRHSLLPNAEKQLAEKGNS